MPSSNCDANGIYNVVLYSTKDNAKHEEEFKKIMECQVKCVSGEHSFIELNGNVKWCSYCGTVNIIDSMYYPEVSHFLPKGG